MSAPPGITEHDWRRFQARKAKAAEVKLEVKSAYDHAAKSSSFDTFSRGTVLGGVSRSSNSMSSLDSAALQSDMAKRYNLAPAPRLNSSQTAINNGSYNGGNATRGNQAKPVSAVALLRQQERQHKRAYAEYQELQRMPDQTASSTSLAPAAPFAQLPDRFCGSCDAKNKGSDNICTCCGYFLAGAPAVESETLAQRRGLAPPNPKASPAISLLEWSAMETSLRKRNDAFCPICMEAFKGQEVLLSCSHMLHRS